MVLMKCCDNARIVPIPVIMVYVLAVSTDTFAIAFMKGE